MSFRHLRHIIHYLVIFLIDSELFDSDYVLEHNHFARRIGEALFDFGLLLKPSHCVDLSDDSVYVAITTKFIKQLLLILDVLFGTAQF